MDDAPAVNTASNIAAAGATKITRNNSEKDKVKPLWAAGAAPASETSTVSKKTTVGANATNSNKITQSSPLRTVGANAKPNSPNINANTATNTNLYTTEDFHADEEKNGSSTSSSPGVSARVTSGRASNGNNTSRDPRAIFGTSRQTSYRDSTIVDGNNKDTIKMIQQTPREIIQPNIIVSARPGSGGKKKYTKSRNLPTCLHTIFMFHILLSLFFF